MKTTNNIKAAIKYFLLVAFAIVTLFPFYWESETNDTK